MEPAAPVGAYYVTHTHVHGPDCGHYRVWYDGMWAYYYDGRWERRRSDARWVNGHWERGPRGHVWREGYWSRNDRRNVRVYR